MTPPLATAPLERGAAAVVPALIWSSTTNGEPDWLSPAWSTFTGKSIDVLRGRGWLSCVHPEDLERCVGIRSASFDAQAPYSLDVRLQRHDGEFRWMLEQGVPRPDKSGAGCGFVGSLVDIHDRKGLEEALADRTRELRLGERRQGEFLAMLSHDLRNPLAPIANAASVLRTIDRGDPMLARLGAIIERQVGKLGGLIDRLVDATHATHGEMSLVLEPLRLEDMVESALARSRERIVAGGHHVDLRIVDAGLTVSGDARRLAQALANLIDNAAEFSPDPGPIEVTVRRVARTVHVSVVDHGSGIGAEFAPHAFELFAQADQSRDRRVGGLGVGLSLARRVVQLHGGEVEAFSEGVGRGTEVILWLPLLGNAAELSAHSGGGRQDVSSSIPG